MQLKCDRQTYQSKRAWCPWLNNVHWPDACAVSQRLRLAKSTRYSSTLNYSYTSIKKTRENVGVPTEKVKPIFRRVRLTFQRLKTSVVYNTVANAEIGRSRDVNYSASLLSQSSVVYIFKRICGMLVFVCRSLLLCCHLVWSVLLHDHTPTVFRKKWIVSNWHSFC